MTSTADCSLSSSLVSGADVQSLSSPDTPPPACSFANVTVSLPSAFPVPPLPPPSLRSGILVSGVSSFPVPDLSTIYVLGAPSSSRPSSISHAVVLSSQPSGNTSKSISSSVIPTGNFQLKVYNKLASASSTLATPRSIPGHILLPAPKDEVRRTMPVKFELNSLIISFNDIVNCTS
ncbi:hypothetical protein Cgig2_005835 [Carnegiea gigantea]|uniref:Uncharacterized protein n=1 Tax=Carnegiea gigantea TaxID=171969 RepID=A0A9Q1GQW0_9CARY|nr:hypothetical protein Cgig2_012246 [Carnegiea gigantea]KAJ8446304.1 hypothetical protein Cgig2_005835 [Carnegiea gigantea]